MNVDLMLEFARLLQEGEPKYEKVPQSRLVIDKVTKQLSAKDFHKIYGNVSNKKGFRKPEISGTQLWPYGVTSFDSC